MRSLVAYSSLTGNTKMVAEAIADELGTDTALKRVEDKPSADGYDLVAVGFWVDRGTANKTTVEYLKTLRNCKVALFATLGADPTSEHAKDSLKSAAAELDGSNEVIGMFICQGKVDPKLIEQMSKMFPPDHPHGMNEARRKRHEEASKHPNEQDLMDARAVFAQIKKSMLTAK